MRKNIVLIGFASSGKTVVGRAAAQMLKCAFVDFDHQIERLHLNDSRQSLSCREIFVRYGANRFRALETRVLQDMIHTEETVISTGGGAPVNPVNHDFIRAMGAVVYLYADPEIIFERMKQKGLPAWLRDDPTFENMKEHWTQRDPIYRSLAGKVVDTSDMDVATAAAEVASCNE